MLEQSCQVCSALVKCLAARTHAKVTLAVQSNTEATSLELPHGDTDAQSETDPESTPMFHTIAAGLTHNKILLYQK